MRTMRTLPFTALPTQASIYVMAASLVALAGLGCSGRSPVGELSAPTEPRAADIKVETTANPPADETGQGQTGDGTCLAEGRPCYHADVPCCDGTFCAQDPNRYGVAVCMQPQPNGSFCRAPAECASGQCIDNLCRADACLALRQPCYHMETSCCDGTFCAQDPNRYGVAVCMQPQPNGSFCRAAAECASKQCAENICAD